MNDSLHEYHTAGPVSWRDTTEYSCTLRFMSSHIILLMHLVPRLAVVSLRCVWLTGLTVFSVPALSPSPGCDYRSQKKCGLSVGVSRAEYCLNRNSCAALYPDVANRVCVCESVCVCLRWMRGYVQGAGLVGPCGWAVMEEADYYLPFLKYSKDAVCVLSLSASKIMNMQKNVESN